MDMRMPRKIPTPLSNMQLYLVFQLFTNVWVLYPRIIFACSCLQVRASEGGQSVITVGTSGFCITSLPPSSAFVDAISLGPSRKSRASLYLQVS
jgi:hypothetical protein